jgi:hypothetical protein
MSSYPLFGLIQEETTGEQLGQSTGNVFENLLTFFGNILAYLLSVEFLLNLGGAVVVVALAILFYKLTMRFVPHLLRWLLPEGEGGTTTHRTRARIQRSDTAVVLVRQILRYVIFAVAALFIASIFLRDVLPSTVAGAFILAAVLVFGAQSFLRDMSMAETVLAQWEGTLVRVHEVSPADDVDPGEMPLGSAGRIVRVGSDGFIFQPAGLSSSPPDQAEEPLLWRFYPWHAVRLVERTEPQG